MGVGIWRCGWIWGRGWGSEMGDGKVDVVYKAADGMEFVVGNGCGEGWDKGWGVGMME